jgi:hypothetical protein
MGENLLDVNGCSKKSLGLMVQLRGTRQDLWPRVIPKRENEDFFDTYSLVARLTIIRVLLSLVASHGFLNGELEEEIYMDEPDGFVTKGQEGKVCKSLKSLYCLKQAPKQWNEKFDRNFNICCLFLLMKLTNVCTIGMVGVKELSCVCMLMTC